MGHVFISYSSSDRAQVGPLVDALRATGREVWWDADLEGGSDFRSQLEEKIQRADRIVLIWTKNAATSRWVLAEAEEGASRNILLPIRLDGTKLPLGFGAIQALDFRDWNSSIQSSSWTNLLGILDKHNQSSKCYWFARISFWTRIASLSVIYSSITGALAGLVLAATSYAFTREFNLQDVLIISLVAAIAAAPVWLWSAYLVGRTGIQSGLALAARGLHYYRLASNLSLLLIICVLGDMLREANVPIEIILRKIGFVGGGGVLVIALVLCLGSALSFAYSAIRGVRYQT